MKQITIAGKTVPLKYTLSAFAEMEEKIGRIDEVQARLKGKSRVKTLAALLEIMSAGTVTAAWVMEKMRPAQFMEAYLAVLDAYSEGMRMEDDPTEDKEVDVGLLEIKKKQASQV